MKILVRFVLVVAGLIFIASYLDSARGPASRHQSERTDSSPASNAPKEKTDDDSPEKWRYWSSDDPMTSKPALNASITSANSFDFAFPYQGSQFAKIALRNSQKYGKDVILSIQKGQFVCGFPNCSVMARWDDAPPVRYTAYRAADGSTTVLFIGSYAAFVAKLAKAKRLVVSATVYHEGDLAMSFDVAGFDPKRYASP